MTNSDDASDLTVSSKTMAAWLEDKVKSSRRKRAPKKRGRKSKFRPEFIQVPMKWVNRLRTANVNVSTYRLAFAILAEKFRLDQSAEAREIVLSREVTGLDRKARGRAIGNLVKLKLIRIRRLSPK